MAAGLGFKTFTTGEVLTAADTNGYLMQGVLVFASAAARDAAITSPQEGQFAYLKDTNVTTYYTGSAWANLDTTGMTNPMTTTGDMVYSSSGSTPARLGIGTTGQVVTVAGGIPTWATPTVSASALTFIASASPSAAASQSFDNCFSATYQNYLIVMNMLNSVGEDPLLFRMRASSTDATGSDYDFIQEFVYSTSQLISSTNNATSARCSIVAGTVQSNVIVNINRPFDAAPTVVRGETAWYNGDNAMRKIGVAAVHNVSTSYDGITIFPNGGTMTGTIRIYGYSNS